MRTRLITVVALLASFLMTAGMWSGEAQVVHSRILVNLPHSAIVGDTLLEPGSYELRELSPRVVQIYRNDILRGEAMVTTLPTQDTLPAEETLIRFRSFGGDRYYLDRVWIQGRSMGYEFMLPEQVRSLEQELSYAQPQESEKEVC